jgi:segregation and condensation protein B
MELKEIENIVEGILFAMGGTVEALKIAKALEIEEKQVVAAINSLKESYAANNRGITITEIDGAYQMCTNPEIYEYLIRIAKQPRKYVLTDVLLETLSIIAYKQPITKSEIEKIRGVSCDFAVSKLVEFGLCAELGRLDAPGRPMLFGTTEEFLRSFGVSSIEELPELSQTQIEEFKIEAENEANNVEVTI